MEQDNNKNTNSSVGLPPIKTLFSESWQAFTRSLLGLFILNIGAFIATILAVILTVGALFFTAIKNPVVQKWLVFLRAPGQSVWPSFQWSALSPFITLLVVVFVVVVLIGLTAGIGSVLIVANQGQLSVGKALRRSLSLIIPLLLTTLLAGLINLGSLALFFLPVLIVSCLLAYVNFAVILENKRYLQAIKSSVQTVGQHFGEIVVRFLIYWLIYVGIAILVPGLVRKLDPQTTASVAILSFVVNYLLGWFGMAFSLTLYRQAKAVTDPSRPANLTWILIVTVLGWIIIALVSFAGYQGASRLIKSGRWQSMFNRAATNRSKTNAIMALAPSACGLSIPVPATTATSEGKLRKWLYEEIPLDKNNFYVLDSDVFPVDYVLGSIISFKSEVAQAENGQYNLGYPGLNVFCVDNNKGLTLEEYKSLALANKHFTVTVQKDMHWGEVTVVPVLVEGKFKDQPLQEPAFLAVSQDGSRLLYIRIWSATKSDPLAKTITQDIQTILDNLKYRSAKGKLNEMTFAQPTSAPAAPVNQIPNCTQFTIREGEFASDKCYTSKDLADLQYYIQRFNSAVSMNNAAIASMQITCNGSDFFKNSCERDKAQKAQAENDINQYRTTIQGIIAKGK
ncbi:hypothetical protein M1523_04690 [Patescibacteria group bacterium]|nr:hypothetical protein [Patescibacteria group bacterium]